MLAFAPPTAGAQDAPVEAPAAGADLTVYLVTVGAGGAVWERFGHNLLWVRSSATPVDSVWDWGRFSFEAERFFLRLAQGDMRYWMAGENGPPWVNYYAQTGRTVSLQELTLTPSQRLQLLEFLRWNADEAHRYYQYHFYNDNCSTRIRDALDAVLGGAIRARTETLVTPWSYRDQTTRLNEHNPLLYFGLTTLLAGTTDRKITAWEEMFLPSGLERYIRDVRVPGERGQLVSLVASEQTLAVGGDYPVPGQPSRWWPGFLLVGLALGTALAATGRSRHRTWGRAFLPLAAAYLLLAGLLGLTMALLWSVTSHEVAWRNENLWQFNLASLALLAILPSARRGNERLSAAAWLLALAIVGCSLFGIALKVFPAFDQANWDVIALALPANVGLALGVVGEAGRSEKRAVPGER
ncbi:MAG TPA: DUF4105 domain-containing protein [Gemmatimonadales bacterium]|nr:DUF4105 domain-containing protein [Gemmatimonadales bacterium]